MNEQTDESELPAAPAATPRLWNPNAAGLWSFIFSPAFGAFLLAKNWDALGRPDRARANMLWFWGILLFLAVSFGSIFISDSTAVDRTFQFLGLGLLISWFLTQCKPQMLHIKEAFSDTYPRRGWAAPLLLGFGVFVVVLVTIFAIAFATYEPSPEAIAEEVRPMILGAWEENPQLQTATIQDITLTFQGAGIYLGHVDATIGGQRVRLPIHVTFDGRSLSMELGQPEE